jgi:hypothetical protein
VSRNNRPTWASAMDAAVSSELGEPFHRIKFFDFFSISPTPASRCFNSQENKDKIDPL